MNTPITLRTINGHKIGEHPTLGDEAPTMIHVDGKWYSTDIYDIPNHDEVECIVRDIRSGEYGVLPCW